MYGVSLCYNARMADDYGYILSFNNSSGLPPDVVSKLNNNFYHLKNMIKDPEIVMTAGIELPDPRTVETLFYKTDTGQLYIWADEQLPGQSAPEKTWVPVDLGFIRVEDISSPASDDPSTHGERIWYNENTKQFYILTQTMHSEGHPLRLGWWSLEDYVRSIVNDEMGN